MTLYYHASNFANFNDVPQTSIYTSDIAASLASLSEFQLEDFPLGKAYIHIFASDSQIPMTAQEYKYIYRNGSLTSIVGIGKGDTSSPIDKGEMYHTGSMLVPMITYENILLSYVNTGDPYTNYSSITNDIGNYLRRI